MTDGFGVALWLVVTAGMLFLSFLAVEDTLKEVDDE